MNHLGISRPENAATTLKGWKVYRQDLEGSSLKYVKTLDPDDIFVVDYNVKWGQEYRYYMFPDYDEAMGTPFVTKDVKACWNDWILLLCREEEGKKDEFAVEEAFLFQLNTVSGQMNNNADVQVFKTYQRYPKVVKGKSNYLSGQLSSLVGYIGETNGELQYIEKIDMIDRLTSLNTDNRRKFLKDKKGHVWEVELTTPSTIEYMENVPSQPVTGSPENYCYLQQQVTQNIMLNISGLIQNTGHQVNIGQKTVIQKDLHIMTNNKLTHLMLLLLNLILSLVKQHMQKVKR